MMPCDTKPRLNSSRFFSPISLQEHVDAGETFVNNISTYTTQSRPSEWNEWFVGLPQLIGMSGDLPQLVPSSPTTSTASRSSQHAIKAAISAPSSTRSRHRGAVGVRAAPKASLHLPISFMDLRHRGTLSACRKQSTLAMSTTNVSDCASCHLRNAMDSSSSTRTPKGRSTLTGCWAHGSTRSSTGVRRSRAPHRR